MSFIKTSLAAALLALAAGASQSAQLQLITGAASGSSSTTLGMTDGDTAAFNGGIDDLTGLAEVLGIGGAVHAATLPGSGLMFSSEWVRLATLDASGAVTRFSASGSSAISLDGTGQLADLNEAGSITLAADLRVAGDGEADGTPVTVRLQLVAESLFDSSVAGAADTPTVNLLVQDGAFNTLASWNGLALSGNGSGSGIADLRFSAQVGQTLSFALQLDNTLSAGNAALTGLQTLSSSTLVEGTLSVSAVPEPQTIALLLTGLGVVAGAARRRTA